jgi:hypothetical protein
MIIQSRCQTWQAQRWCGPFPVPALTQVAHKQQVRMGPCCIFRSFCISALRLCVMIGTSMLPLAVPILSCYLLSLCDMN